MPPRPVVKLALAKLAVAVLVSLTAAGCVRTAAAPIPTPADFAGIVEQLAKQGIAVKNVVSGDAGCADPVLSRTAIGFDASGADQTRVVRIRVYIFHDHAVWQRLSGSVATCARSYVTDDATYESIAPSPFVVSGQGPWGPRFAAGLSAAFSTAAGDGG